MEKELLLPEQLMLLCIKPKNGGLVAGGSFPVQFALIAAILKELEIQGNVHVVDKRVEILSFKNSDTLLGFVLSKFQKFDKPLKINRWFNRLNYSMKHIKKEVMGRLIEKRLATSRQQRFLFFKWHVPVIQDKSFTRKIADSIKNSIYRGDIQEQDVFLISLIEPAGILFRLYPDRHERKNARRRLKQMNIDSEISVALKKAIAGTRAAMAS